MRRNAGAALQAPLSRFGDTATNTGAMALLNAHDSTHALPTSAKTLVSASAATLWRIGLMPNRVPVQDVIVAGPDLPWLGVVPNQQPFA